jgi:hypothetical protein
MDTALEQIRTKITELEAKISNLRIAERELEAIDTVAARQTKPAPKTAPTPVAKQKPGPKPKQASAPKPKDESSTSAPPAPNLSVAAAISEVLAQHGALAATEIAERIKATGRDVNNRSVSFALQALKKRGLAKNTDGKWSAPKTSGRRDRSAAPENASEAEAA